MADQTPTEQDIMLSVWREAGRTEEGVTIPCESEANAKRLRFALYNAVKPVKSGRIEADAALKHGVATCSLSFTEDKMGLIVRPKVATLLNKTLLAALGGKPVASTEELLLGEAFARMTQIEPEAAPQSTVDNSRASAYGARNL